MSILTDSFQTQFPAPSSSLRVLAAFSFPAALLNAAGLNFLNPAKLRSWASTSSWLFLFRLQSVTKHFACSFTSQHMSACYDVTSPLPTVNYTSLAIFIEPERRTHSMDDKVAALSDLPHKLGFNARCQAFTPTPCGKIVQNLCRPPFPDGLLAGHGMRR